MKKNNILAMACSKSIKRALIACALLLGVSSVAPLCAQEGGDWSMTVGADAVSKSLWRGMDLGGPSIQPTGTFDYEKGDWAVCLGFWGTKTVFGEPYGELDLFVEASWKNLTLSLTDYGYDRYFGPWQEAHDLDFGLSYTISEDIPVTFSWSSIINKTFEGSMDGGGFDWQSAFPSYFEVAYEFSLWEVDFGATAGVLPFASDYYENDAFGVFNLNLSAGHEFEFEHGGSLPVSAQVGYNPMWKDFFWSVGVGYHFSLDF